jgi:hypothetical protein
MKAPRRSGGAFKGGIVAGLVGGLVLSVFLLILNAAGGRDVWMGMKGAGLPFLGERAMRPGFDAVAVGVGVLSHFLVSVAWGLPFGLLFYGLDRARTVVLGVAWGFVVWIGMYYLVLPLAGAGQVARSAPVGMAILTHVLFGLSVALAFLRYQPRRAARLDQELGKAARTGR